MEEMDTRERDKAVRNREIIERYCPVKGENVIMHITRGTENKIECFGCEKNCFGEKDS